jgi:plastocyanin
MKRFIALIGVGLVALAITAAVTSAAPDKRGSKTVNVNDDVYSPTSLTVSSGTKVKFKWTGSHKHNVVKKKGPGGSFASSITSADGVQFQHKFSKAGTYKIICTVHPEMTMKINVN